MKFNNWMFLETTIYKCSAIWASYLLTFNSADKTNIERWKASILLNIKKIVLNMYNILASPNDFVFCFLFFVFFLRYKSDINKFEIAPITCTPNTFHGFWLPMWYRQIFLISILLEMFSNTWLYYGKQVIP